MSNLIKVVEDMLGVIHVQQGVEQDKLARTQSKEDRIFICLGCKKPTNYWYECEDCEAKVEMYDDTI